MAIEKLSVILELITGNYKKEARDAASATSQIGTSAATSSKGLSTLGASLSAMKGALVVGALAGAGTAIVKFGADSLKAASNLEESMNAVQVVFGSAAKTITDFGETAADSAGLAQAEFQQMATVLGAALSNAGFEADEMAAKTIELTQRAADMASVFNTTVPDALGAVQAALRGESDPIEKYGVSLTEAAVNAEAAVLGFKRVSGQFDAQGKAAARLSLIMKQTDKVAGDFANTSDSLANKSKTLSARFTDMQARVGKELAPAMSSLLGTAEDLLPLFESVALAIADMVGGVGDLIAAAAEAASLDTLNDQLADLGLHLEPVPGVAEQLATGLDEVGVAALIAGAAISQANTAAREAPALLVAMSEGAASAGATLGNMIPNVSTAAEKYQALARGIRAVISAQLALVSPVVAAVQAQDREREAREKLTELQDSGETTTRELITAELELAVASAEAQAAQELLREQGIKPTAEALSELADESLAAVVNKLKELELIDDMDIRIIFDLDARLSEQLKSVLPYLDGSFGDAAGGPSSPGVFPRQHGGPVRRGRPYLVGEDGPELMVPSQSGMIIPHDQLSSFGGGQTFVTKAGSTIVVQSPMNDFRSDLQYATILASVTNLVEGF